MGDIMFKNYKFTSVQRSQIKHWLKKLKNVNLYRKLEVVHLASLGYSKEHIEYMTGYTMKRISSLIKEYLENGINYFLEEHRRGGNRRNLSEEQEIRIIEKFRVLAEKGQVVDVSKIKAEYEKVRGCSVSNSTFYAFLHRRKWRNVMPRGAHPKKASEDVIEASKKLTLR